MNSRQEFSKKSGGESILHRAHAEVGITRSEVAVQGLELSLLPHLWQVVKLEEAQDRQGWVPKPQYGGGLPAHWNNHF